MNLNFRTIEYKFILSLLFIFSSLQSLAIKAQPGLIEIEQPDGTFLPAFIYGDERFHYVTTEDGYLVLPTKDGYYEFAEPDDSGLPRLSGLRAVSPQYRSSELKCKLQKIDSETLILRNIESAKTEKQIMLRQTERGETADRRFVYSSVAFPVSGEPRSIVVLVEYQDVRFSMENPLGYYDDFLNSDNFTENGAHGSCRKYFTENSNGIFCPHFDVYGPVLLANNRSYYGGTVNGEEDARAHEMIVEAVKYLDPEIDFSIYDHNNDGYLDNIYIIYAGTGEANGGPTESVWPHSWELEQLGVYLTVDGVKVNSYGCSNELKGKTVEGIGTYTHEFCHVLGLPDLYNTYNSSDKSTPWSWSILDNGPYLNGGHTPPNMSAFERYSIGWIEPEEILCSGEYTLNDLAKTNKAYILQTEKKEDEFYILEYRDQTDWDQYLPNHGMLVWHIDFDQRLWDYNMPNFQRNHQCVQLVRADAVADILTAEGDSFPGSDNITEFSYYTNPKLNDWNDRMLNVTDIYDIYESDDFVTFKVTTQEDRSQSGIEIPRDIVATDVSVINGMIFIAEGKQDIYDIYGRVVGVVSPFNSVKVEKGLYIVGGKKLMVH